MEIRIEGSDAVNDWDFWVYPAQVELTQGDVYTTDTLDAKQSPSCKKEETY